MLENEMQNIENEEKSSGVLRDEPNLENESRQFIDTWQSKIRAAKVHFEKDFKRMREDMMMARQGADDEWITNDNYTVPIINRYLNQSVAALYAKNPTASAEKRKTLDFKIWDGKQETAMAALQQFQMVQQQIGQIQQQLGQAINMGDQGAAMQLQNTQLQLQQQMQEPMALLQDIEQGRQHKQLIDKIGRTLEICFDYYANEQKPRLKKSMKALVRRAKTCGVAYLMLGFQRQFAELTPDDTAKLEDARNKMGELQRRMQDFIDDKIDSSMKYELHELETLIADLESEQNKLLREGPVFMFPRSTEIIVDPRCRDLMGFIGAGWIAREFHKTPKEIQKIYNVDVSSQFTPYKENGAAKLAEYHRAYDSDEINTSKAEAAKENGLVCIWEVYNKDLGQTFTIADGYNGFLKPCGEPDHWMEGFWPVFAITFNACESEEHLYPLSDVHQLKHVQNEYNRSREYRRLHREANKPKYMAIKGMLDQEDIDKLENPPPHALIELNGLAAGQTVESLIQPFKPIAIDPALYETNSEMEDVLRTVGAQEANIGGIAGGTATESSIAEGSRQTSLSSNVDDLDEFLSDVVSASGQLMLMELSRETVEEIAGVGAVWPEMNREQIAKQTSLKVKAGSSGRPNKAAELANMERGMPYILQLPNMNPTPIAKRYLDLLEIDLEEAIVEGMPSITALNSQIGRMGNTQGAGGPNDPNQQGDKGGQNNQKPSGNEPGPQPGFPQPNN